MLPDLAGLTEEDLRAALRADRCSSLEAIYLPVDVLQELNYLIERASRDAGARVDSLRQAQVSGAVTIALATARNVAPAGSGLAVGFSLAETWLQKCKALIAGNVPASWTYLCRNLAAKSADLVDVTVAAFDQVVSDPLTVFVAGPITGASDIETESLVAVTTLLRSELVQLRVRLYSAPEEADPRVHREFADDDRWRGVDEHWIRRADLVVILHPRAATGLGVVHELATAACVPILLVADVPVSPMVVRSMTPERLLETGSVVDKVVNYIGDHGSAMMQRRQDVRATADETWRPGRTRLQRDIEALSNTGLETWTPSTITRHRLREVITDDYAYGSMTDFERMQLRQAFALAKVSPLTKAQRLALEQAGRNGKWTDEVAWYVELAGRELLETGNSEWHYKLPHTPAFWEELRRGFDA